jgi:type II secretory ATPase GspE/PulE/Tfp pilus assembly ATPase PilB-like protein
MTIETILKSLRGEDPRSAALDSEFDTPYEILIEKKLVTKKDLRQAELKARRTKKDIAGILIRDYGVSRAQMKEAYAEFYKSPIIEFSKEIKLPAQIIDNVSPSYLKRHGWLPLATEGNTVSILIDNPLNTYKNHDIQTIFQGKNIRYLVGFREDIVKFIDATSPEFTGGSAQPPAIAMSSLMGELHAEAESVVVDEEEEESSSIDESDSTIIKLVNRIIIDANNEGVSDIHIEPNSGKNETIVRFRQDGACRIYQRIPGYYRRAIAARIKILANLDISERRLPQDGKIVFPLRSGGKIELRVATLPTAGNGNEDIVMRLLASGEPLALDQLGLGDWNLEHFRAALDRPYGLILVVGPTGSGKTTTLHSALKYLNRSEKKIWTAEDPVEITQRGLRQVQINPKVGLTFPTALRAFLRADPDVVMIGEMRDKETIDIALKAALTGHLVLSTMHTNSAAETVTRLLDMGVDPFTYSDALLGVLAQRLVRTVCSKCNASFKPDRQQRDEFRQAYGADACDRRGLLADRNLTLNKGLGCDACNDTGLKGRMAIHEFLSVDSGIQKSIQDRASALEILRLAQANGTTTLMQDGLAKCISGKGDMRQVMATANL